MKLDAVSSRCDRELERRAVLDPSGLASVDRHRPREELAGIAWKSMQADARAEVQRSHSAIGPGPLRRPRSSSRPRRSLAQGASSRRVARSHVRAISGAAVGAAIAFGLATRSALRPLGRQSARRDRARALLRRTIGVAQKQSPRTDEAHVRCSTNPREPASERWRLLPWRMQRPRLGVRVAAQVADPGCRVVLRRSRLRASFPVGLMP